MHVIRQMVPSSDHLASLLRLALPVAAVQVGFMFMGAVDTVMVGHLSSRDLAAVALGNLYFFLTTSFGLGTLFALDPLVSQAFGAADRVGIARAIQRGFVIALGLAVFSSLLLTPGRPLLTFLRQPADVIPVAADYALVSIPGVLPFFLFVVLRGKPDWVVRRVERVGGCVYHDVTERKWAQKGVDSGVRGLIAVNSRAGGHPGPLDARALLDDVSDLGLPVVCAGGVGNEEGFIAALRMGYAGVQMGTRFIATDECTASAEYKQAIADAEEEDIVHSERLTGVPVAVINTPSVQRLGLRAGPLARWMLRGPRTKHWMRTIYALKSLRQLRRSLHATSVGADYWQAGKSVSGIRVVEPVASIVHRFTEAARLAGVPVTDA